MIQMSQRNPHPKILKKVSYPYHNNPKKLQLKLIILKILLYNNLNPNNNNNRMYLIKKNPVIKCTKKIVKVINPSLLVQVKRENTFMISKNLTNFN